MLPKVEKCKHKVEHKMVCMACYSDRLLGGGQDTRSVYKEREDEQGLDIIDSTDTDTIGERDR